MQQTNKLNMEEKKKLEKIAMQDIDNAVRALAMKKLEAQEKISSELVKNPSQKVKDMLEAYTKTFNASQNIEKELDKLGYSINRDRNTEKMSLSLNSYNDIHKNIVEVKEKFEDKIMKVESLKREVIVGLYTTGQEAKEFLTDLGKKLEALLG